MEMARTSQIQWRALSRRTVVIRSLACAAGAAASLAPVNEASAKMAQKSVEYQDTPKGDQQRLLSVPGAERLHAGRR
jgi:hypothetical protein